MDFTIKTTIELYIYAEEFKSKQNNKTLTQCCIIWSIYCTVQIKFTL